MYIVLFILNMVFIFLTLSCTKIEDEDIRTIAIGFLIICLSVNGFAAGNLKQKETSKAEAVKAGVAEWVVTVDKTTGEGSKEFKWIVPAEKKEVEND